MSDCRAILQPLDDILQYFDLQTIDDSNAMIEICLLHSLIDKDEEASLCLLERCIQNISMYTSISIANGLPRLGLISYILFTKFGSKKSKKINSELNKSIFQAISILTTQQQPSWYVWKDNLNGVTGALRYLMAMNIVHPKTQNVIKQINYGVDHNLFITRKPFVYLDLGIPHGLGGKLYFFEDCLRLGISEAGLGEKSIFSAIQNQIIQTDDESYINTVVTKDSELSAILSSSTLNIENNWCYGTLGLLTMFKNLKHFDNVAFKDLDAFIRQKRTMLNLNEYFNYRGSVYSFCHGLFGTLMQLYISDVKDKIWSQKKIILILQKYLQDLDSGSCTLNDYHPITGMFSLPILTSLLLENNFEVYNDVLKFYLLK